MKQLIIDAQTGEQTFVDVIAEPFDITAARTAKLAELSAACNATILDGFTSDALGIPHFYDFDYEAQTNIGGMLNAITAGISTASFLWKASGIPMLHTPDRFKTLFTHGLAHKNANIGRYWALESRVYEAATSEEIAAVVW